MHNLEVKEAKDIKEGDELLSPTGGKIIVKEI